MCSLLLCSDAIIGIWLLLHNWASETCPVVLPIAPDMVTIWMSSASSTHEKHLCCSLADENACSDIQCRMPQYMQETKKEEKCCWMLCVCVLESLLYCAEWGHWAGGDSLFVAVLHCSAFELWTCVSASTEELLLWCPWLSALASLRFWGARAGEACQDIPCGLATMAPCLHIAVVLYGENVPDAYVLLDVDEHWLALIWELARVTHEPNNLNSCLMTANQVTCTEI